MEITCSLVTSLLIDSCQASMGVSMAKVRPLFLVSEILSISGRENVDTFNDGN